MGNWWLVALGTVAGICTTFSFLPQLMKAWREGDTEAISTRMYLVSLAAFGLWVVHGFLIGSLPVLVFNALSLLFSGAILALKLRHKSTDGEPESGCGPA